MPCVLIFLRKENGCIAGYKKVLVEGALELYRPSFLVVLNNYFKVKKKGTGRRSSRVVLTVLVLFLLPPRTNSPLTIEVLNVS